MECLSGPGASGCPEFRTDQHQLRPRSFEQHQGIRKVTKRDDTIAGLPQNLGDIGAYVRRFLDTEDVDIKACRAGDRQRPSPKRGDGFGFGIVKIEDFVESGDS